MTGIAPAGSDVLVEQFVDDNINGVIDDGVMYSRRFCRNWFIDALTEDLGYTDVTEKSVSLSPPITLVNFVVDAIP